MPPELTGKPLMRMAWTWDPVERNYTYPGHERQNIEAHIYAAADEVELLQNGKSLGRKKPEEYKAVFVISYEPGELTAIAYQDGKETGRDILKTAGKTAYIELTTDRNAILADGADLCFVTLRALDENDEAVFLENGEATLTLQGGGELFAFGSADPKPDRLKPFREAACPLYRGTALAVIRSEERAKGCVLTAAMKDGVSASLKIGFTPVEIPQDGLIGEIKAGPLDDPLSRLLANEKALAVLNKYLPELIGNPMLNQIKSMSIRKLASMGNADMLPPDKVQVIEEALKSLEDYT
jgi:beta-galactosidase